MEAVPDMAKALQYSAAHPTLASRYARTMRVSGAETRRSRNQAPAHHRPLAISIAWAVSFQKYAASRDSPATGRQRHLAHGCSIARSSRYTETANARTSHGSDLLI